MRGQLSFTDAIAEIKADGLLEAAAEQRRLADGQRTTEGRCYHEEVADWLEERAGSLTTDIEDLDLKGAGNEHKA